MYSSLKIYNNTVIELKALAKQCRIKGYYKFRKAELIQKLEPHPDLNDQVLTPGLEISRKTATSVNTSAILDEKILHDNTPVLKPTPNVLLKECKRSKLLVADCWITCNLNQTSSMKLWNRFKI